ncbi:hypothetical protein [Nonomuraea sp. NPDC003754]
MTNDQGSDQGVASNEPRVSDDRILSWLTELGFRKIAMAGMGDSRFVLLRGGSVALTLTTPYVSNTCSGVLRLGGKEGLTYAISPLDAGRADNHSLCSQSTAGVEHLAFNRRGIATVLTCAGRQR